MREARADGEGGLQELAEIRWEGEVVGGLSSGDLGIGQSVLEGNVFTPQMVALRCASCPSAHVSTLPRYCCVRERVGQYPVGNGSAQTVMVSDQRWMKK